MSNNSFGIGQRVALSYNYVHPTVTSAKLSRSRRNPSMCMSTANAVWNASFSLGTATRGASLAGASRSRLYESTRRDVYRPAHEVINTRECQMTERRSDRIDGLQCHASLPFLNAGDSVVLHCAARKAEDAVVHFRPGDRTSTHDKLSTGISKRFAVTHDLSAA
jgi:hypothetical protein